MECLWRFFCVYMLQGVLRAPGGRSGWLQEARRMAGGHI